MTLFLFLIHTKYNNIFDIEICLCPYLFTQLCLILCNPMNCSLPGSAVHRIFPGKIYWGGLPFPTPRYIYLLILKINIIIHINKSIFLFLVPSTKFLFLTNNLVYPILFLFIISICKYKIKKIYLMFLYSFRAFSYQSTCAVHRVDVALLHHQCFRGSSGLSPDSCEQKQWCTLAYATYSEYCNLLTAFLRECLLDQN